MYRLRGRRSYPRWLLSRELPRVAVSACAATSACSSSVASVDKKIQVVRLVQQSWSQVPVKQRLRTLREFRHLLAVEADGLAGLISPNLPRTRADTLSAEVLPLADAVRFLELKADEMLAPQKLSKRFRPLWLRGVHVHVQRDPWGVVLVIGPSNYPLFLPAVQAIQALVAGNAVFWKPGTGGATVASAIAQLLMRAGLPAGLINVTDESADAAQELIAAGVDKIVMTGSETSGRAVLTAAAEHLTPATVELSGCDAMFVLRDATISRGVDALLFGLRFNGSGTCIAPRRIFLHREIAEEFKRELIARIGSVPPAAANLRTSALVDHLIQDALAKGAALLTERRVDERLLSPVVLYEARPEMKVMQTDVFAPIAGLCIFDTEREALALAGECKYALGATVFGSPRNAFAFARNIAGGIVVINDMIAPTADPRISFGGRQDSGFGKSRGAEGLLEMTSSKTLVLQTAKRLRHLEAPHPQARELFSGFLKCMHGRGWGFRARSLFELGKTLAKKSES